MQVSNIANAKEDRYQLKFVNGSWVCFDTVTYENTNVFFLKSEGERLVGKFNKGGK